MNRIVEHTGKIIYSCYYCCNQINAEPDFQDKIPSNDHIPSVGILIGNLANQKKCPISVSGIHWWNIKSESHHEDLRNMGIFGKVELHINMMDSYHYASLYPS